MSRRARIVAPALARARIVAPALALLAVPFVPAQAATEVRAVDFQVAEQLIGGLALARQP